MPDETTITHTRPDDAHKSAYRRKLVLEEIAAERSYQEQRWGNKSDDTLNTPWMWVAYIACYATKWMKGKLSLNGGDVEDFRNKMIKTAAIAVAAVESIDRQRKDRGAPFYETQIGHTEISHADHTELPAERIGT
jgi:hypothetical protein